MEKKLLYVANWKSYLSYTEALSWFEAAINQWDRISKNGQLVICPDFLSLSLARLKLPKEVFLGAQDCSAYGKGAFTGEVSAISLKEIGVSYVLVGHSERRNLLHEDLLLIVAKANRLLAQNIIPVLCINEQFKRELPFILDRLENKENSIACAYEPESAIGGKDIPALDGIDKSIKFIKSVLIEKGFKASVLYGGNVNSETIKELKKINSLEGFLIGRASIDFQQLKKIVG